MHRGVYNHGLVLKKRRLSLCHRRASMGSEGSRQVRRQSVFTQFRSASCHCFASCICCHDPFIVRNARTRPLFTGFTQLAHPSRCSRSTLTTVCLCVHIGSAAPSPDPSSSARHLHLVVECGIHGQQNTNPAELQCCCSTEAETGFVPTSAQFFAVGTFLILKSPSWTRSCIQKYRVSMCFVRCPAPNRSVKEFAVELSLCISIFIGTPRSWYIDLRDNPT